jgi:DNA-binding transcriptional regulator/RsmH inhibitor MraZ
MRDVGETVTILISITHGQAVNTETAFDIVNEDIPPAPSTDTKYPTYAKVNYVKTVEETFDEAGRVTNENVRIEFNAADASVCLQADRMQVVDGSIFRIKTKNWSEGRERFIMEGEPLSVTQE